MLRRRAVAVLLGAARSGPVIERLFGPAHGAAVLLDFRTRRVLAMHGSDRARQMLSAPGSTLKPFSLLALLVTQLNTFIANLLNWRAKNLKDGLDNGCHKPNSPLRICPT